MQFINQVRGLKVDRREALLERHAETPYIGETEWTKDWVAASKKRFRVELNFRGNFGVKSLSSFGWRGSACHAMPASSFASRANGRRG